MGCYIDSMRSNLTEIVDLSSGETWIAGNLNIPRSEFGLSMIRIGSKVRLIAFGGTTSGVDDYLLDSIEMFDEASQTWKITTLKLQQKRSDFGHLNFSSRFMLDFS